MVFDQLSAHQYYCKQYDNALLDIQTQALAYRKGKKFVFSKLYPNQVNNVWLSYVKHGIVLHTKPVDQILETVIYNTALLEAMTACMGHTQYCGIKEMVSLFELTPRQEKKLHRVIIDNDKWACFSNGQWLLSDYGIKPIRELLLKAMCESDYSRKICYIDQIFNVVHQRSDLAEMYIHGGSKSLTYLSELAA